MELEQRVKTLEYEMKILKNEVQRTLLDIQEQVLVHYYPVLRTEETKPSEGMIQSIEALRARQMPGAPVAAAPEPAVPAPAAPAPQLAPVAAAAPAAPAPALKKVTLEEIRAAQNELVPDSVAKAAVTAPQVDAGSNGNRHGNGDGIGAQTAADSASLKLLELLAAGKPAAQSEDKQGMLDQLTKLNSLVERAGSVEEALRMLGEAKVG
ncbi:MAG: hypothetical protein M1482_09900 [Chloroflexi bacterium]|nr:hypothetical protein [Chloroflexota bacterium]